MALPENTPLHDTIIYGFVADVSTASSAFAACPCKGRVIEVGGVLHAAITGADALVTSEINGTAITGGGFTVANASSAAGDVDTGIPTAANVVNKGDTFEWITDGASSTTAPYMFYAIIRRDI